MPGLRYVRRCGQQPTLRTSAVLRLIPPLHFSLPTPSYVRLLRDADSAPTLASALGVGARLHREASMSSMSAVLSLHSDVRLAWSSRELLRSRDPTLSDTAFGPAQPDRVLRQSPTFTAPLAEGGMKSYQAGPLTAARVSDHDARVLWDNGYTSSYDPHPWILIQPEFAAGRVEVQGSGCSRKWTWVQQTPTTARA
jgi:hypothetical protein